MSDDLISRQAAINMFPDENGDGKWTYNVTIQAALRSLPSAQPEHGEDAVSRSWLLTEYDKRHKGAPGGARKLIEEAPSAQPEPCDLCSYLEKGDTLYQHSDWDGGIGFDYIWDIQYCPKCGRRLE